MQKQATQYNHQINQEISTQINTSSILLSVRQFCATEPAFTEGGMRHLFFVLGHDLPGVYRLGRRILIDRAEFIRGIKSGKSATIAGMVK